MRYGHDLTRFTGGGMGEQQVQMGKGGDRLGVIAMLLGKEDWVAS